MNQKQFETHVKRQLVKLANNMCMVCIRDKGCTSPVHGKVVMGGEPCPQAELMPSNEFMKWALKNLYGLSPEQCDMFEEKMKEHVYE